MHKISCFVVDSPNFNEYKPQCGESTIIATKTKMSKLIIPQGNYGAASQQYSLALTAVGRPLPGSVVEKVVGVMWQWTRQILQRLHLGTWLARHAGGLFLNQYVSFFQVTNLSQL